MLRRNLILSATAVLLILVAGIVFFSRSTPDQPPSAGPPVAVSTARGQGPLRSCQGIRVKPASDIASMVPAAKPGTTFCLTPGVYSVGRPINVKSGDTFIGTAPRRDGVTVKTDLAQIVFDLANASGVTFEHFGITGAINACPGSNCGETGRAISQGAHVTVRDMHLYGNGRSGIGGTLEGLTVTDSEVDHNGASLADGVSAGIKAVKSMSVINSYIHDNINNGIWCDIQCGRFIVRGNTVTNNSGSGIFMEISQGPALIANNIVKDNNTAGSRTAGGIAITDSHNVIVRGNELSGNKNFGIAARMDQRINCGAPSNRCGFVTSNATIIGNTLHGDPIEGCNLGGVECVNNH